MNQVLKDLMISGLGSLARRVNNLTTSEAPVTIQSLTISIETKNEQTDKYQRNVHSLVNHV